MPRIDVNKKFCCISDADQWTVFEKGVNKKPDSENFGKETLKPLAYLPKLAHCYTYLLERQVRLIESSDLKVIMDEVEVIKNELIGALKSPSGEII